MRIFQLFTSAIVLLLYAVHAYDATGVGATSDSHTADIHASDLFQWLHSNGAYINEKLSMRNLVPGDPSSPRGLFSTKTMEVGETAFSIPSKLIVRSSDELTQDCDTIKSLVKVMSGDDITPYGRILLDQPRGYTAGYWSEAGKALLANMLKSSRAQELTEYDELPPHGVQDVLEDLKERCDGDIDDPLYLHAAMLVHARADYEFMVPLYDMLNHHNGKHNIEHKVNPYDALNKLDEVDYEMVASKVIGAGDQLYLSYNHGSISKEYLDWFGTPQMFLSFGFVEPMPQRWLFDFARVKFDLDWKDGNEATGEQVVTFLVPPSSKGMDLLQEEINRLDSFSTTHRTKSNEDYEGMPKYEWDSLWQYYDALHGALSRAVENNALLSDDAWKLDDDWWVQDGTLVATDEEEHYVLPTRSYLVTNDEL